KSDKTRMASLWSLLSGKALSSASCSRLLKSNHVGLRSWGVRAIATLHADDAKLASEVVALASDQSPDVQLQVTIAAKKFKSVDPLPVWMTVLANCGDDPLIPHIVWQNLHPSLPERADELLSAAEKVDLAAAPGLAAMLPKVAEKLQN
ncbi:MAG: dehydrogenase, partial [Planctomycetota bacterium]